MKPQLPRIVEAYVRAINNHDAPAFIALFADDAVVDDIGREFPGLDAIKAWSDREIFEGGGFDTFRFWEILGHNCILLTESIDVFPKRSQALAYDRVFQFANLYDFVEQLDCLGSILKTVYPQHGFEDEYKRVLREHGSDARVLEIFRHAAMRGLSEDLDALVSANLIGR